LPYDDEALERRVVESTTRSGDERGQFAHDRDRILYSTAFRRLAGKTQVAAAEELGLYHTRLTHSLKVAQLGRRLAERLRDRFGRQHGNGRRATRDIPPPDPDLVEAACLAHDLGHPPFGHQGEETLCEVFDQLATLDAGKEKPDLDVYRLGGFEGNAQTFRIIALLATRLPFKPRCGLNLTRATLDAATKYPRLRVSDSTVETKWGAIEHDRETLEWVRAEAGVGKAALPSFESELMDWCDDVTYAVHDVVDFYRGGFIPLDRLSMLEGGPSGRIISAEASDFIDWAMSNDPSIDASAAREAWLRVAELIELFGPWEARHEAKARVQAVTSQLITFFVEGVDFEGEPCRHNGSFIVDRDKDRANLKRLAVDLLKKLLRRFVIDRPALATLQRGHATIVTTLLTVYASEPSLLPHDRTEDVELHGDHLRAATDYVASLTEQEAQALYRRLKGIDFGALSDPLI
jgi:dGTPase